MTVATTPGCTEATTPVPALAWSSVSAAPSSHGRHGTVDQRVHQVVEHLRDGGTQRHEHRVRDQHLVLRVDEVQILRLVEQRENLLSQQHPVVGRILIRHWPSTLTSVKE